MDFLSHKGASFHSFKLLNKPFKPSLKLTLGFHPKIFFILILFARILNGSPGLLGILTIFFGLIILTIEFTETDFPHPKL